MKNPISFADITWTYKNNKMIDDYPFEITAATYFEGEKVEMSFLSKEKEPNYKEQFYILVDFNKRCIEMLTEEKRLIRLLKSLIESIKRKNRIEDIEK